MAVFSIVAQREMTLLVDTRARRILVQRWPIYSRMQSLATSTDGEHLRDEKLERALSNPQIG